MNRHMKIGLVWPSLIVVMTGSVLTTFAQEQQQTTEPTEEMGQQDRAQMGQASPEMREMASSLKSMADMCQMMMQREMRSRPYWIAAIAVVGTLLALALVLFIVLEIQWIRLFGLRVKVERKNLR